MVSPRKISPATGFHIDRLYGPDPGRSRRDLIPAADDGEQSGERLIVERRDVPAGVLQREIHGVREGAVNVAEGSLGIDSDLARCFVDPGYNMLPRRRRCP